MNNNSMPFVSVIVPVYNDPERISKCIEALLNQTYPEEKYEVIIIDNGSADATQPTIKRYPVTLLVEDNIQTSYAARNKGIHNSRGEIIAFTDADCIPAKDWIEKGVKNLLRDPECGLVGGTIKLFPRDPKKPNIVELYSMVIGFDQKRHIEQYNYGSTANVFTFRKVIENVGPFKATLRSGGDSEWGKRVLAYGYRQVYADDVILDHPARNSFSQLCNRTIRLVGGNFDQKKSVSDFMLSSIRGNKYSITLIIRTVLNMNPTQSLRGIRERLKFIFACMIVECIRNCERIRLLLGGSSKR